MASFALRHRTVPVYQARRDCREANMAVVFVDLFGIRV